MDAPLKELEKLQKLVSDEPSMGKSKTPAIQDSLNSLLQTLYEQKKKLEAGLATESELTTLARTVEARKKEIDERQKEIYNSLARYGKALDKVGSSVQLLWGRELTGFVGIEIHDAVADVRTSFWIERGPGLFGTCHCYALPQDGTVLYSRDFCAGTRSPALPEGSYAQHSLLKLGIWCRFTPRTTITVRRPLSNIGRLAKQRYQACPGVRVSPPSCTALAPTHFPASLSGG